MLAGYNLKQEQELRHKQYQAWYIAQYVGMMFNGDKLPNLDDIMTISINGKTTTISKDEKFIKLAMKNGIKVPDSLKNKYS